MGLNGRDSFQKNLQEHDTYAHLNLNTPFGHKKDHFLTLSFQLGACFICTIHKILNKAYFGTFIIIF